MTQRTLIIMKPDAIQRGLMGEIFTRFERRGFKLVAAKLMNISYDLAQKHYAVHRDKPFYRSVCEYLSSSPAMVTVWEGVDIIRLSRNMIGATVAAEAMPGTIRGDHSLTKSYNLVHGSDSPDSAAYEIPLYFTQEDTIDYKLDIMPWLLGNE